MLKAVRKENEERLQNPFVSQGSFFSNIINNSTSTFNFLWSSVQSKLPKNIFNFTIRYINNTLPIRKSLAKWGLSPTSDSVLNFLARNLQSVSGSSLYVDLPGYNSPSVITGDRFRPDLLLSFSNEYLYIVELTVGYESNLQKNVQHKKAKYSQLISEQSEHFEKS